MVLEQPWATGSRQGSLGAEERRGEEREPPCAVTGPGLRERGRVGTGKGKDQQTVEKALGGLLAQLSTQNPCAPPLVLLTFPQVPPFNKGSDTHRMLKARAWGLASPVRPCLLPLGLCHPSHAQPSSASSPRGRPVLSPGHPSSLLHLASSAHPLNRSFNAPGKPPLTPQRCSVPHHHEDRDCVSLVDCSIPSSYQSG